MALSNSRTSVLTVSRTNGLTDCQNMLVPRSSRHQTGRLGTPTAVSSAGCLHAHLRRGVRAATAQQPATQLAWDTCWCSWTGRPSPRPGSGMPRKAFGFGGGCGGVRCHHNERRFDVPAAPVGITQSLWPQCGKRCAAFTACRRPSRWWPTALGTPTLKRSPRWRSVPAAVPAASPSPIARVRRRGCFPAARLRRGWVRTPRRGPDKPAQPFPPAHASLRSVADARPATNSGQNPRTSSLGSDRCARPLSTPCSGGPGMRSTCPAGAVVSRRVRRGPE